MTTSRDPDRLVLFTDAVTAIAVTLLILPVVDVVGQSRDAVLTAVEAVTHHQAQLWTFLLSFVVIARFWLTHHRLFEHVRAYDTPLIWLSFGWLLAVIVLPFPTEMIGAYPGGRFTSGLYIGTILVLALFQLALVLRVRGHEELEEPDRPVTDREVFASVLTPALFVVAFLLAVLIPGVNFYALFVVFLAPAIVRLRARRAAAA